MVVEDRERGFVEARLEGDRVEPVPLPGSGAEQDRLGCRFGLVLGRELAEGESFALICAAIFSAVFLSTLPGPIRRSRFLPW
ncbi:MAG: hypothetical protein OZ948_18755 [Deltaproteobacteria bacterium]|nr:hypothetical protein [Deltaproteobacteria bacterium]